MEYLDPNTFVVKGTIHLSEDCGAIFNDEYRFELRTTKRTFLFLVSLILILSWMKGLQEYGFKKSMRLSMTSS
jgi:predicted nucleic acid-binding Zn ribbon protein